MGRMLKKTTGNETVANLVKLGAVIFNDSTLQAGVTVAVKGVKGGHFVPLATLAALNQIGVDEATKAVDPIAETRNAVDALLAAGADDDTIMALLRARRTATPPDSSQGQLPGTEGEDKNDAPTA